jgi:glutaredoxin
MGKIIENICSDKYSDYYIILYSSWCGYSQNAIQLLNDKNVKFKGYIIENIDGDMSKLLKILNKNKDKIDFNSNHTTRPIIFYNKKFIGGYSELKNII